MKMKIRKILFAAFTFLLIVSGVAISKSYVKASDTETFGDYVVNVLDDGTLMITKYKGSEENVIVPSEFGGVKVTVIGRAFENNSNIKTITIPEGISEIKAYAFYDAYNLEMIKAPSTLHEVGICAFNNTKWLKNRKAQTKFVTINKVLVDASQCTGNVVVPGWITSIGGGAFGETYEVSSVTIPKSIKVICDSAFLKCHGLRKVNIPSEVTSLGENAFGLCRGLTEISLPDSVTSIGKSCFANCSSLEKITFPKKLEYVGPDAFYGTKWLNSQQEKNPLVTVANFVVNGEKCTGKVEIPDGITHIAKSSFWDNDEITEVVMSNSVVDIGEGAFECCDQIKTIKWSANLKSIGKNAFAGVGRLTELNLPKTVEYLGKTAFYLCTNVEKIVFSPNLKYVGAGCFSNTAWMKNALIDNRYVVVNGFLLEIAQNTYYVTIPEEVKYICDGSLRGHLVSIKVPENVKFLGVNATDESDVIIYGYDKSDAQRYAAFCQLEFSMIPCETPVLTSAVNSLSGISVKWNKSTGASGYYVYRKTTSSNWSKVATVTQSLAYLDKTAVSGVKYYYTVKAYDSENVSGCDTKGVSVIRVGQPDFTVSNGYSGINLNWTAVKGVNQYNIYRKTAQSTNWTKVVTVTGTSWTDTNVTNGSRYQYTVKAIIGSVMSTCHPGKTMYRLTSPVMSSLTEASSGTAVATWSKNAKATGYQLRYATKLDMTGALTASNTTNSNAKTIFGLNKGTMYYVQVRSFVVVDGVKYYSGWSNKKSVKIV